MDWNFTLWFIAFEIVIALYSSLFETYGSKALEILDLYIVEIWDLK